MDTVHKASEIVHSCDENAATLNPISELEKSASQKSTTQVGRSKNGGCSSSTGLASSHTSQNTMAVINPFLKSNPLQDPRFVQLMEHLEPMGKKTKTKPAKLEYSGTSDYTVKQKKETICFRDICLNETCKTIFKRMNIN